EAIRGLDAFSHLWVIYGFHLVDPSQAKPTVRPPRLGGNQRVGVFASRSPFRPNGLGLSVVKILTLAPGRIEVGGVDMVNGSPVYDLKPYLPYVEAIPEAKGGYARAAPASRLRVEFVVPPPENEAFRSLITAVLSADPR